MSVTLFQRLCAVRKSKLERAQREYSRLRNALVLREQALELARGFHRSMIAGKQAVMLRWRADRIALVPFDPDARESHQAELARCDRRISEALEVVARRFEEREETARNVQIALEACARRQVELTKAKEGVSKHRLLEQLQAEAIEEDELDELAVLRPRHALGECRA